MRHLPGIGAIAAEFDGFIVDLWGVVHDGVAPYPGAIECLRGLRSTGAPVLLLSNAPRRAYAAAAGLSTMGIGPELYSDLLTSGEATWEFLASASGLRVYHLGPARDRSILEDRDVQLVDDPREAELLLNTGPDDHRDPTRMEPFLPDLQACLRAGLPMLCANPDLEVIRGGQRVICAGALAVWYQAQGGVVQWIGKPYPDIYRAALSNWHEGPRRCWPLATRCGPTLLERRRQAWPPSGFWAASTAMTKRPTPSMKQGWSV